MNMDAFAKKIEKFCKEEDKKKKKDLIKNQLVNDEKAIDITRSKTIIKETTITDKVNEAHKNKKHSSHSYERVRENRLEAVKSIMKKNEIVIDKSKDKTEYEKNKKLITDLYKQMTHKKAVDKGNKSFLEQRKQPHTKPAIVVQHGTPDPVHAFGDKANTYDKLAILDKNGEMIGEPIPIQAVADALGAASIIEAINEGKLTIDSPAMPEAMISCVEDGQTKAVYAYEGIYDFRPEKDGSISIAAMMNSDEKDVREYSVKGNEIIEEKWDYHQREEHDNDLDYEEELIHQYP